MSHTKLSFSLPSKSSLKNQNPKPSPGFTFADKTVQSSSGKEYVTDFDAAQSLADSQPKSFIIPPLPSGFQPLKKMKNLDLIPIQSSTDDTALQFEVHSNSATDSDNSNISYGLNLRQWTKPDADSAAEFKPKSVDTLLLNKLKDDLKRAPENDGFDDFADVPVESFAAALLGGYGWSEGKGIGRNSKEDVKVMEYKRRTSGSGLGFVSNMPDGLNNKTNGSERGLPKSGGVLEKKENGTEKYFAGKEVRIIGGKKWGLKGKIVELVRGGNAVFLKLSRSEEEVSVSIRDIADLGSVEEEKCLRKLKESRKEKHGGNDGEERRYRDDDRNHKDRRKEKREHKREDSERNEKSIVTEVPWLASHIRVRIISKDLKGGKLYLKKGKIVDVVGPTTCDISMDESRELIQGVDQELLETALPRRGGPVLVLYGRHKGVYGCLVERDADKETGVVRNADTQELLNVPLDQIAEYAGDPSDLGY